MEKLLFSSARRPEKVWFLRNTLRSTSLEISSTGPGLLSPSAALRSWKELYALTSRSKMPFVGGVGSVAGTEGLTKGELSRPTGFSKGGAAILGDGRGKWYQSGVASVESPMAATRVGVVGEMAARRGGGDGGGGGVVGQVRVSMKLSASGLASVDGSSLQKLSGRPPNFSRPWLSLSPRPSRRGGCRLSPSSSNVKS